MAISHADHNHPNTPAARAACRKRLANGQSPFDASAERTVVDPGVETDTNADNVPGPSRIRRARLKVNTSDMPRNIRSAIDWGMAHYCTWTAVEHRAGQVTIEMTGPSGVVMIAYSRENPVGVQAISFRPNGTSVASRVPNLNEALRMVKG